LIFTYIRCCWTWFHTLCCWWLCRSNQCAQFYRGYAECWTKFNQDASKCCHCARYTIQL